MIINGNYYQQTQTTGNEQTSQVDSLATYMNEGSTEQAKSASDVVQLSDEAYAALKEYAPEALTALGYNDENPVLEEMKEIAVEKYFHFGNQYLSIPSTEDDMVSALDVANRYMDALNSIEPDEIYEAIAGANTAASGSSLGAVDIASVRSYVTA
jgi:hypothetical protein